MVHDIRMNKISLTHGKGTKKKKKKRSKKFCSVLFLILWRGEQARSLQSSDVDLVAHAANIIFLFFFFFFFVSLHYFFLGGGQT